MLRILLSTPETSDWFAVLKEKKEGNRPSVVWSDGRQQD
jgi:hypothetical protein